MDFYSSPNGVPGLALSIMKNTSRTTAEAWAFRSLDMKRTNERTKVGVVYDDGEIRDNSKSALDGVCWMFRCQVRASLLASKLALHRHNQELAGDGQPSMSLPYLALAVVFEVCSSTLRFVD